MRGLPAKYMPFVVLFVFSVPLVTMAEDKPPRLMVFDIQTGKIRLRKQVVGALTDFLATHLSLDNAFEITTHEDFVRAEDALWKYLHEGKSSKRCDDMQCRCAIVRQAKADGWVSAKIEIKRWRCALVASIRRGYHSSVVVSAQAEGPCTVAGIHKSIGRVARILRQHNWRLRLPSLSNADVLGAMRQHIAEFKACNRKGMEIQPSVKGKMVVRFIVENDGTARVLEVTTPQFQNTFIASCISGVIENIHFPQSSGKPKEVPFPFTVK